MEALPLLIDNKIFGILFDYENNMIRYLKCMLICLGIFMLAPLSQAQDGIDTALFKGYKVKKMWVYVKLPILPSRTLDDSCLVEIYNLDTLARIIYQKNAKSCYGWGGSSENFNTYDSLNRIIFSRQLNEDYETNIRYYYNNKNDVIKIIQNSPQKSDSFTTLNEYTYAKNGFATKMRILEIIGLDTTKFNLLYDYDKANNIKTIWTYTHDMKLIEKRNFDITPISKKVLEFSTETKLPKESFTKGWNYYNFDAQLSRTQYSNNTWTEFIYSANGLLDQTLSYNMQGKLNSWKRSFYSYYE